jgi:hypothetical protein
MLRAAFIRAALDAGVPLRDVQIAARHADPRTTTIYDRRRQYSTATRPTSSSPSSPADDPGRATSSGTWRGRLMCFAFTAERVPAMSLILGVRLIR